MRREDIPIPAECATNPDDRTRVLTAKEPHAYRSALRRARQILRSHLEESVLEPGKLETEEVPRLDTALVISSRPKPATSNARPGWVEFRPYDEAPAKVGIGRRCRRLYEYLVGAAAADLGIRIGAQTSRQSSLVEPQNSIRDPPRRARHAASQEFPGERWTTMKRSTLLGAILASMVMLAAGCGISSASGHGNAGGSGETPQKATHRAYSPHINPADFTTKIDNKYFPLKPGTTFVYQGETKHATEGDVVRVTSDTKNIMGVECVVVDDKGTVNGKLTEQTYDWYAQDKEGNVWYFGEDSKTYKNGKVTSTKGSWEAGKNGAEPGIIMPANPKVGHTYRQEYFKGVAEDMAQALRLNGSAKVPYGSFNHVLVTKEWSPLEPNVVEHKYYAAGVGDIKEVTVKGPPETLELVDMKSSG